MRSRQFVMLSKEDSLLFRYRTLLSCSVGELVSYVCWWTHSAFLCFRTKLRLCRETKDGVTRS